MDDGSTHYIADPDERKRECERNKNNATVMFEFPSTITFRDSFLHPLKDHSFPALFSFESSPPDSVSFEFWTTTQLGVLPFTIPSFS